MTNFNIDSQRRRRYDAIVIGSGISGGWAAKELCEKGLRTLVLERGRDVKHVTDYPTAMKNPWEFEHRGQLSIDIKNQYAGSRSFLREETLHWAIKPDEQPFIQEKPFTWTRGYHVGGKSLLWARQSCASARETCCALQKPWPQLLLTKNLSPSRMKRSWPPLLRLAYCWMILLMVSLLFWASHIAPPMYLIYAV